MPIDICKGCWYESKCRDEDLACIEFVKDQGRIDKPKPTSQLYRRLTGQDVDKYNERLVKFAVLHAQGKRTIQEIHNWIMSNVHRDCIKDLTIPAEIKPQLTIKLWRDIGVDRVQLRDFVHAD